MQTAPTLSSSAGLRLEHWRPEHYNEAAALIHRSYAGHDDALINDQYQTIKFANCIYARGPNIILPVGRRIPYLKVTPSPLRTRSSEVHICHPYRVQ